MRAGCWFACILLAWTLSQGYAIASFAKHMEERQADGIVVLGAAVFGERPSPVFAERINHAIQLYKEGYAPTIIFTGGRGAGDDLAEAEAARQYAIQRGVQPDDILVETRSRTTEQNLFFARQLARQHQLRTLIVVSDPLHMRRAMLIARDMGLDAYSSPTPTSRYQSPLTRFRFLIRETHYYTRYLLRRPFYRFSSPLYFLPVGELERGNIAG